MNKLLCVQALAENTMTKTKINTFDINIVILYWIYLVFILFFLELLFDI